MRRRPRRPIGPQRTNSMRASEGSALGAMSMVPPVYLLLLKDRNRQRRSSQFLSSSQRSVKARRRSSATRSEEHTSELQSRQYLVCRLLLEKKKNIKILYMITQKKKHKVE